MRISNIRYTAIRDTWKHLLCNFVMVFPPFMVFGVFALSASGELMAWLYLVWRWCVIKDSGPHHLGIAQLSQGKTQSLPV